MSIMSSINECLATCRVLISPSMLPLHVLLSVEQVESTVVEIVERSLEFCLLYLEKSSYACEDYGLLVSSLCLIYFLGNDRVDLKQITLLLPFAI